MSPLQAAARGATTASATSTSASRTGNQAIRGDAEAIIRCNAGGDGGERRRTDRWPHLLGDVSVVAAKGPARVNVWTSPAKVEGFSDRFCESEEQVWEKTEQTRGA